ncbi:MAG TPA: FAD-linked oxidase C-terminal domain-containing protein [Acidimicrobiales bacterium]|jgi:FAD/FMN-containing dehydrogenase/Fe-S oxidoreductase|nr:FAD-linked oxidase C-terminal domain-containing protein [Acidimicrobiales bacterium]
MTLVRFPRSTRVVARHASDDGLDTGALEAALREVVDGEVRFDAATRALYANDGSNFRRVPIGVVIPRTIDDVVAVHEVCRRQGAPILARGCGTSLSGETVNHAVVIDFTKHLHHIGDVDPDRRLVRVEPGAINEQVNHAAVEHGLAFGPDPATHAYCTIGGNIGNNSCGTHSLLSRLAGNGSRTSDNLESMEVLTYDGVRLRVGPTSDADIERRIAEGGRVGQIYRDLRELRDRYGDAIRKRFAPIPRRVSGYNLDELLPENGCNVARALAGTEGTCVTVLEATLQLVPHPPERSLLVIGYPDIYTVGRHLTEIVDARPTACEAIDHALFHAERESGLNPSELSLLPDGQAWVLVEMGGDTKAEADDRAEELRKRLAASDDPPSGASLFDDPDQEQRLWKVRESALAAETFPQDEADRWQGWEDSAVPPERMGDYLRDLHGLLDDFGYHGATYGHLADGCVHSSISFDLRTAGGLGDYRRFLEAAADLVVSYGGSLSGEHGDGQQRAELLPRMFGDELVQAFREFKAIWDPDGRMNPGKIVDPDRFDEHLKLGTAYNPSRPATAFAYPDDHGDFAHATLRCVGVGKCRTPEGVDVMCPSFSVLGEEQHTTRGRAHLLDAMLRGDVITDGWRSQEVFDALDLCLACKGCTNDCPVNVDMPTYKAEFLHHHWARRLRPRHAYAFGLIDQAARVGSHAATLYNIAATSPLASAIRSAGGVAPERELPKLAHTTLQRWHRRTTRKSRSATHTGGDRPSVVLWPDTFNNYFHADVGIAAAEVLDEGGFEVLMPRRHVCCGRPLYDYGFLDMARRYLHHVLDELRPWIRAGIPVVGIEPSCLAVFKDELPKLVPHDDDARRLADNAMHFAEFVDRYELPLPRRSGDALLWGHCHQKATGGIDPDARVLARMGYDVETLTGGCCGLAGSWGYEADHYDLSMACGEQGVLPAVRAAAPDSLVVANGFSCQTQIATGTDRRARHLAQVINDAN